MQGHQWLDKLNPQYDLFISYAKEDRDWVEGYLLDALRQANITYLTEAAFELGKPRLLAFEEAVQQSKRILLVLSPAYLMEGHTLFIDLLAEQYGLETGTWPVIPLILKPVEKLPLRLRMLNPLDMTDRYERESALQRLVDSTAAANSASDTRSRCTVSWYAQFHRHTGG